MTEPTEQSVPAEPHEGLDAFDNPEAKVAEEDRIQPLQRASGEKMPPADAPPPNTAPTVEGTGAGDPLAGVKIDDEDAAHAVAPEDGSANPR